MACIFTTQYLQLTNGAKTSTHIVFCRFLIKCNQNLVNFPWKYTDQRRLPCKNIITKAFFMLFWYGVKKGIWFSFNKFRTYKNRWRIGHPFWPHTKSTHKKLLFCIFCILSVADPYIFRGCWPNFDCFWW